MIGFFRRRRYRRAFNGALIPLIGTYVFERLDEEKRRAIDAEVDRNLNLEVQMPPASIDRKWGSWSWIGAERAVAMARLGIPTGIPGYAWDDLLAPYRYWKEVRTSFFQPKPVDMRGMAAGGDFHPFHQATEDAKDFMRKNGYLVLFYDPPPPNPRPELYVDPLLDGTGLRAHLEERLRKRNAGGKT